MSETRKKAARTRTAASRTVTARARVAVAVGEAPQPAEAQSPTEALREVLRDRDGVRAILREEMARQAKESAAVDAQVIKAFASWSPTLVNAADRANRTYLAPGQDVKQARAAVIERGIERMKATGGDKALRVDLGGKVKTELDTTNAGGGTAGTLAIETFTKVILGTPEAALRQAMSPCEAKRKLAARMNAIEGKPTAPATNGTTNGAPAGAPASTSTATSATTKEMVARQVEAVMGKTVAPEEQVRFEVPSRATQDDAAKRVETFQLRAGASDVTSYHDFHSLQIAFEHIWLEVFDGRLREVGMQLYDAYIKVLGETGRDDVPDRVISSIADLQRLLDDGRSLQGRTQATSADWANVTQGKSGMYRAGAVFDYFFGSKDAVQVTPTSVKKEPANVSSGATRLSELLAEMDKLLGTAYAFTVYAEESVNFGILVTYRQTWKPESYQVGDLVSTIPLAPREVRRYTTKHVSKTTRSRKQLEDNVRTTKTEADSTSRVEREIITKAEEKTNFKATAKEDFGAEGGMKIGLTQDVGGDQSKSSAETKKHFHEAVLKSAQEYRQQNKIEIDTTSSEETEGTTFHEIQNPNDELTVTYLFYELQRTYRISEKIHKVTPVVLVANKVPLPEEITDGWLMQHDWIIRRASLDDSFKPALDYLTKSFVGAEINIRLLENNVALQKQTVDALRQQVEAQSKIVDRDAADLKKQTEALASNQQTEAMISTVKRVFDPLQIGGSGSTGTVTQAQTMVDYWQESVDRAERERMRLLTQLGVATTALQVAIDKLSAAIKEHYDKVTEIDRLRIHVKENILYYMQAIWDHEPPDQRFFRVHDIDVPVLMPLPSAATAPVREDLSYTIEALQGKKAGSVSLEMLDLDVTPRKLVELADIDNPLGYKGNYAIFPLKRNNYLTLHMMQNYLELTDELKVRDPDDLANYTVDELQEIATCMFKEDRTAYEAAKKDIEALIMARLTSSRPEDDRVIVPTTSLYIDALVGTHPLLEDFKQIHRALDVKKVQAEVRRTELENVRLAARALEGQFDDPDVDRKIVIEGQNATVALQPDNN